MPELDIVIPVYNEGANIIAILDSLRQAVKTPFRVLICYDFEEDNTLAALDRYVDPPFEIARVRNKGRGPHAAVVTGFRASEAPAVLVFPADDVYNAKIIDTLVENFRRGCAIAAPSRFMAGGRMEGCPWLKAVLVRTASFTLHSLARLPIHDATNGFRLFSRRVIDEIEIESSTGFTYSMELLVKAHRQGWKLCETPAVWFERGQGQGKSKFKVLKWLPAYLRWYFYAFATTFLRRRY
jgi:dolichol-phosphate mannosyltransferase